MKKITIFGLFLVFFSVALFAQSEVNLMLTEISTATSANRIEKDIKTLVNFGTRHTLSDTISKTKGIGAARRWVKSAFEEVSKNNKSFF